MEGEFFSWALVVGTILPIHLGFSYSTKLHFHFPAIRVHHRLSPSSSPSRETVMATAASFRWILQLHKDVPKAAKFYKEGLGFNINVCTLRWAELDSGPLKLALMQSPSNNVLEKGYSSLLSFTVTDINSTMTKLMSLGAELDGPIKYEVHGKVAAVRCIDGHMLGLYEPV